MRYGNSKRVDEERGRKVAEDYKEPLEFLISLDMCQNQKSVYRTVNRIAIEEGIKKEFDSVYKKFIEKEAEKLKIPLKERLEELAKKGKGVYH